MKKNHLRFTIAVTCVAMVLIVLAAVCLPWILKLNSMVRVLLPREKVAILAGYYCCLPVLLLTLWKVWQLLKNMEGNSVFTDANIRLLAGIRNGCVGVFGICLVAGCFFFPLFLVVAILGFLALMMQVLKQVMAQAVALREENDLTV